MSVEVTYSPWTRRMFLGSGIAAGVGSTAGLLGSAGLFDGSTVHAQERDVVLGEIVRQLETAVHQLRDRANGESARRIGSSLHLLAAWGKERKIDDQVRQALRTAVRREGRAAILAKPFDAVEELRVRGYKLPPGAIARATQADYSKALDDLLANGVTRHWTELARKLEAGSVALDRRIGLVRLQDEEEDRCAEMKYMEVLLESTVFFFCVLMSFVFWEACLIVSAELLAWKWYMWLRGC
jgi:hypothetical protein